MNNWISVEDRLPSTEGLLDGEVAYVIVAEYFNITRNYIVSICGYGEDGWSDWDNFGGVKPRRITHWQPLPEPPKED